MIEQIITLVTLISTLHTTVGDRHEAASAADFRQWLKDIFPQLLDQSENIWNTVIALKANQTEQYAVLIGHLEAIRALVGDHTAQRTWNTLRAVDQNLLRKLYDVSREDLPENLSLSELLASMAIEESALLSSARLLEEMKLVDTKPGSNNYWCVAATSAGVVLAWEMSDPDYAAAVQRIKSTLCTTQAIRLQELVDTAKVPRGLTYALMNVWTQQGHVVFKDNTSPFYMGVITSSEKFRIAAGQDVPR